MMFKSLNNKFWIVGIVVAIALLLILEQFVSTFWVRILTGLFMWIGLAMSWNIVGGYTGYINFGHGAFFGIGAYVTGLMLLGRLGIRFPFFPALILVCCGSSCDNRFTYLAVERSLFCYRNLGVCRRYKAVGAGFGYYRRRVWYKFAACPKRALFLHGNVGNGFIDFYPNPSLA